MRNSHLLAVAVLLGSAGITAAQSADELDGAPSRSAPVDRAPPLASSSVSGTPMFAPGMAEPGAAISVGPSAAADGPFCNTIWLDAEYLFWWTKSNQLPPLLTQGSPSDANPGALGQPGTSVLYGGNVNNGGQSGGRLRTGMWFGNDHVWGVDGSFFFLGRVTKQFNANSPGDPVLAVPYYDVNANQQGALTLAYPDQRGASYTASLSNRLWGADADLRAAVWRTNAVQFSLLGGVRYLQLTEKLETSADMKITGGGLETVADSHFDTSNDFYGGQVGAEMCWFYNGFSLDLLAKVAVGDTHESATIEGGSLLTGAAGSVRYPFAGLAQKTNIGTYSRDILTWVPEGGVNFGYQFSSRIRATLGYTFLYTSRAVRPGNIIDTGVNPTVVSNALLGTPITGQQRPGFPGLDSTFWAQGISAGLEFRY